MKIKKSHFFCLLVLILSSIRGVFVYHLNFTPNITYAFSAILLVFICLYAIKYLIVNFKDDRLNTLRKAMLLNYVFFSFYTFFIIVFLGIQSLNNLYFFIVFPLIFLLIKINSKYLEFTLHTISAIVLIGTFIFYQLGVNFGFDAIESANLKLRPGELSYARIGENYLPGGYLGSHHDNANILVMSSAFYLSFALLSKTKIKYLYWLLFLVFTIFSALTGSASNIIALCIIIFFAITLFARKLYILSIPVFIYFYPIIEDKLYFFNKITQDQNDLEAGGVFNSLNLNSILKSAYAIVGGGGYIFNVPMVRTEVAFLKILISIGFIPFIVLMFILFSPIYYCYLFNKRCKRKIRINYSITNLEHIKNANKLHKEYLKKLILFSLPVLTGTITLLHYGSLFRITSIGMFSILLALFFKAYLYFDFSFQSFLNSNSKKEFLFSTLAE